MSRESDSDSEAPRPPGNRFCRPEPPPSPLYQKFVELCSRPSAKPLGKQRHYSRDTKSPPRRFHDALRGAAAHPAETGRKAEPAPRSRVKPAYKPRAEDLLAYSSETSSVSQRKRLPKSRSGHKKPVFSAASSAYHPYNEERSKALGYDSRMARPRAHLTAAAAAPLTDPRGLRTSRRRPRGPCGFQAKSGLPPLFSDSFSPRSRSSDRSTSSSSSCSDYSLSALDSENSRRPRRRPPPRPRGRPQDQTGLHNASSLDTQREQLGEDNASNNTSETYSSDDGDDSSDTDDFGGEKDNSALAKPEPIVKQSDSGCDSSDFITESDADLSASSVSSDYRNIARQLHRKRCKKKEHLTGCLRFYGSSKGPASRSETAGQQRDRLSSTLGFPSRAGRGELRHATSDSESDSQEIRYGADSGKSPGVARRGARKQRSHASSAGGFGIASQLHIVGREARQRPPKMQLFTVISSASEDESCYHSANSGSLSSGSERPGPRDKKQQRLSSSGGVIQTALRETTPFTLLQEMEKLTLHESPEPVASHSAVSREPQGPPKTAYPTVSFSVTYKAPANAKYILYVCGTTVELGSSLVPCQVGYRGVPLEEDPDGIGCSEFWQSDPVQIRSVPPGTDIYYTYYVMEEAKVNSTIRKHRYQIAFQERLLPGTTKKAPNTLPLDIKGARSFRLPTIVNVAGGSSNTRATGASYRMADYRFGDVSRKGRFCSENQVDHHRDNSDSGSESPDF